MREQAPRIRRLRLLGVVAAMGVVVLGIVSDHVAGVLSVAVVVFVAALVAWTIRIDGAAHGAWAQGSYGNGGSDTEHGYVNAVRRLADRRQTRPGRAVGSHNDPAARRNDE